MKSLFDFGTGEKEYRLLSPKWINGSQVQNGNKIMRIQIKYDLENEGEILSPKEAGGNEILEVPNDIKEGKYSRLDFRFEIPFYLWNWRKDSQLTHCYIKELKINY